MPREMAGQIPTAALPAAIAIRQRLQTGLRAIRSEHPIHVQTKQRAGIKILDLLQGTAGQAHGSQRQGARRDQFLLEDGRTLREGGRRERKHGKEGYGLHAGLLGSGRVAGGEPSGMHTKLTWRGLGQQPKGRPPQRDQQQASNAIRNRIVAGELDWRARVRAPIRVRVPLR